MKRFFEWHPLLLGVFPILFLYAQNAYELDVLEIVRPLAAVVVATLILSLVFTVVLRNSRKGALLMSGTLLLFFSFGHVTHLIASDTIGIGELEVGTRALVSVLWIALWLVAAIAVAKARPQLRRATAIISAVAVVLVSVQVAQSAYIVLSRPTHPHAVDVHRGAHRPSENLPDIYFIVMDGYARQDILKDIYGYDNADFIERLESLGFVVTDHSCANYCQTLLTLVSELNLDYLHRLWQLDRTSKHRWGAGERLKNNAVFGFLHEQGYSIVAMATGYGLTELTDAEVYIRPGPTLSEFANLVINTTPIPLLLGEGESLFDRHRQRVSFATAILRLRPHHLTPPSVRLRSPRRADSARLA